MKIALCGSAPSSVRKAPFGDPGWQIWGCSPGLYPHIQRVDAWFEIHRWEPPVIGKPDQQVEWFSPEYCLWLANLSCPVWMLEAVPDIRTSRPLPWEHLVKKYGHFFFTSSLAWMAAMAIEQITENRKRLAESGAPAETDAIGFWGVDMAADEEQYTGQKAGCQFFATLAASLNIQIYTPPESDLMVPRPLYGVYENRHRHIKLLVREKELKGRQAQAQAALENAKANLNYVNGALDDMRYHMGTWIHEGEIKGTDFEHLFQAQTSAAPAVERELEN